MAKETFSFEEAVAPAKVFSFEEALGEPAAANASATEPEVVTSARPWQGAGAGRGGLNDPRRLDVERPPESFERPGFAEGFTKGLTESERPMGPGGFLLRAADALTGGFAQERFNKANQSVLDDKTDPALAGEFAKPAAPKPKTPVLQPRTDTISPTGGVVDALAGVPANTARSLGSTVLNFGALAAELGLTIQSPEQFRRAAADLDKAKARTGLGVSDQPLARTGTALDALIPSAKTLADYAPEGIKQLGMMAVMGPGAIIADAGARGVNQAREEGLGIVPSVLYGAGQAASEGVPEAFSAKFAIEAAKRIPLAQALRGDAKAVTTAFQQTAQTMGVELGSEQVSALGNWVVDKIAADPTATPDRLVADMKEAVKATIVQGPTMLAGAKLMQSAATGLAPRPEDQAARELARELERGNLPPGTVETLNPNLSQPAITPKTLAGLTEIGAAASVDEAIIAAARATTPQAQAVDNIGRLLGDSANVSQPGNIPPVDSGAAGAGAPEPGIRVEAGVGASGAAGPALDAGGVRDQPAGGAAPLAAGRDAELTPDIAETTRQIQELERAPESKPGQETRGEPASVWFGRRGDGYQTPEDAQSALPTRTRISPELDWRVEQMPTGRYRLAGYDTETRAPTFTVRMNPTGTATVLGNPKAIAAKLAEAGITEVLPNRDGVTVATSQAQAAAQFLGGGEAAARTDAASAAIKPVAPPANPPTQAQAGLPAEGAGVSRPAPAAAPEQVGPYGRDLTPIAQGGKPFKTKAQADAFRKANTNNMRTVKQGAGFVLRDLTAKELAAREKAAKRLAQASTSPAGVPIPAHAFIAGKGGLAQSAMADAGFDRNMKVGNRWLFAGTGKPGLTLAEAAELLAEAGYIREESEAAAAEIIKRSIRTPQYTAEGWERIAEAEQATRFEDHLAAQQEAATDEDPFGPAPAFTPAEVMVVPKSAREEYAALIDAIEAAGLDADAILEEAARITENLTQEQYSEYVRQALTDAIANSRREADRGESAVQGREDAERGGAESRSSNTGRPGDAPSQADEGLTARSGIIQPQEQAQPAPALREPLSNQEQKDNEPALTEPAETDRYAAGKALTKEQRKQVLGTLVDVYKAKDAPREQKGIGPSGNERYGYVHSPELFEKSDITGAMVRYYVTLPDGRIAHPSELFPDFTQAQIDTALIEQANEERREKEGQAFAERQADSGARASPAEADAAFMQRNRGFELRDWRTGKTRSFVHYEKDGRYYSVLNDDDAMMRRVEKAGWTRTDTLTAPTRQEVLAQQDRREQADDLDQREQIQREASGFQLQAQAPEQRRDNTGDMFGGPTAEDVARARDGRREADAVAQAARDAESGQGGLFASEPTTDYTGAYETDLFGEPLPAPRGNDRAARPAGAGVRGDAQPASTLQDTPAPRAEYYVNTFVGSPFSREIGASRVTTPEQAAQATRYLYRSAVERFDGIVTDKDGKPLAIVGGFKGAVSQASVYPATVMGEAVRIPGAAHIWFSHNHPSGTANLSTADERLNMALSDVFKGSGIEPMGLLAIAGDRFAYVDQYGSPSSAKTIPEATTKKSIPVIERELGDGTPQDAITTPGIAKQVAAVFYKKASEPGVMLLNSQNAVAGWFPITPAMMGPLRGTGGLNAIYRAVSQSNAASAIIVHGGELDYAGIGDYSAKVTPSENIAAALAKIDVRPLDSVNVVTNKSVAEQGREVAKGPLFSRAQPFYSALSKSIEGMTPKALPGAIWKDGIKGLINKGAVKEDEVEWSGIREWLDLQTGKVSKEDVLAYLDANGVQVEEVVLGGRAPWLERLDLLETRGRTNLSPDERQELDQLREDRDEFGGDPRPENEQAKYGNYTLPGGENYREVLLTLPQKSDAPKFDPAKVEIRRNRSSVTQGSATIFYDGQKVGGPFNDEGSAAENYRRTDSYWMQTAERIFNDGIRDQMGRTVAESVANRDAFRSSHWDEPNVLAHIRLNDRTDADGKRVLFVEELQSDWGQEGKKKGFASKAVSAEKAGPVKTIQGNGLRDRYEQPWRVTMQDGSVEERMLPVGVDPMLGAANKDGPPLAPFVTNTDKWLTLALKRVMVMAAQEGYDAVAFVNGEQSAERYDLSKQISRVTFTDNGTGGIGKAALDAPPGYGELQAFDKDGRVVISKDIPPEQIEDYVGKEVAKRLLEGKPMETYKAGKTYRVKAVSGVDLKVGGKGMRIFYDRILPNTLKDVLKKVGGGRVEMVNVGTGVNTDDTEIRWTEDSDGIQTVEWDGGERKFDTEDEARAFRDNLIAARSEQPGFTITPEMREKASAGLPLFRKGADQTTGLTAAQFTQALSEAFGAKVADRLQAKGVVVPLADQTKLPAHVVPFLRDGDIVFGFYDPRTNRTYAVLENLTPDMVKGLAMHEVGVHYGFEAMLGADKYKQVMKQLRLMRASGNRSVKKASQTALKSFEVSGLPGVRVGEGVYRYAHPSGDALAAQSAINKLLDKIGVVPGSSVQRGVRSDGLEQTGDRGLRAADQLADLLVSQPAIAERLSALDVKTQNMVLSLVRRSINDSKILKSIVEFVPIDVMDVLKRGQLSAEAFLDDGTMLSDLLSIDKDSAVALRINVAGRIAETITRFARFRAKNDAVVSRQSGRASENGNAALEALTRNQFIAPGLKMVVTDDTLFQEELAYLVQNSPENSVIKDVIARIKAWLFREFGIGGKYLTTDDLTALARAAVQHAARTEPGGVEVPAFMRASDDPVAASAVAAEQVAAFRSQYPATPPSGMSMDTARTWLRDRRTALDALVQKLAPMADGMALPVRNGGTWLVSREARPDGSEWRITRFDQNMVPQGHEAHRSAADAVADLVTSVDVSRLGGWSPEFSRTPQTETKAFKDWFGDSKVVDAEGKPLIVYHGTTADLSAFDLAFSGSDGVAYDRPAIFATDDARVASDYARNKFNRRIADAGRAFQRYKNENPGDYGEEYEKLFQAYRVAGQKEGWDAGSGANVLPLYLSIQNPLEVDGRGERFMQVLPDAVKRATDLGHDGVIARNVIDHASPASEYPVTVYIAFAPEQVKSATGNRGTFDPKDPDIRFSRTNAAQEPEWWQEPGESKLDKLIYEIQDGRIDLKRVQEAIKATGKDIAERFDARMAETLYPGRVARRTDVFLNTEVRPLLQAMALSKIGMDELGDYLIARHAPERNAQVAKVNPDLPDGGAGRNSQGELMTDDAAAAYLAALSPEKAKQLAALAKRVDSITAGTRELLVGEGLEKPETVKAWTSAYKNYVPLFKDEAEHGHPIGTGFNVGGSASKRSTGSTKEVTNVLAHVLMQREAVITRAEKNRVGLALYGLALSHPNKNFWTVVKPGMSNTEIAAELQAMGVDPMMLGESMDAAPTIRTVDTATNQVVDRPNPMYKKMDGAITLKVAGEDRVLLFNEKDERALRLATNLKNMDGATAIDWSTGVLHEYVSKSIPKWVGVAPATRWLASVNTQYNPVFGLVNVTRDVMGGVVNLTNTPLRKRKMQVLGDVLPALKGISRDLRGGARNEWSDLFNQFQDDGGQTGFKEMFRTADDRARAIEKELQAAEGKLTVGKATHAVLDLLDDFNTALENAVRLSAYKAGLDEGMSRPAAAKLARELTVDFNRKGRTGRELGPLYAFLNASIQGTARTVQTLAGPAGAKIVAGGLAIGGLQALMLAFAGFDEDEPPEWVKTRGLIIPIGGDKRYIVIPLALGLHVIPNTGRVLTELALYGGNDAFDRMGRAIGEIAGAFNPLGGGNIFTMDGALRTVMPTVIDPFIELGFNKNFAGSEIEKRPFNEEGDNRPGFQRARESTLRSTTGQAYLGISKAINTLTGGNDFEAGAASPTPERIRYLAQTVGGGLLREMEKAVNVTTKAGQGDDIASREIPMAGRFVGQIDPDMAERARYFESSNKIKKYASSLTAAEKAGADEIAGKISKKYPEVELANTLRSAQERIRKLNKNAAETINDRDELARIDRDRFDEMKALNAEIKAMERLTRGPTLAEKIRGEDGR